MSSADECAQLLLETVPRFMRTIGIAMRRRPGGEDDQQSVGHLRLLSMMRERSWKLSELAQRHLVSASTMSRTIDTLVQKSWVDRQSHPEDRRQVILKLTEQGRLVHESMIQHSRDAVAQLIDQLDHTEREQLYTGLTVLRKVMAQAETLACEEAGTRQAPESRPAGPEAHSQE